MVSGCLAKVVCSDARHNFLLHYLAAVGLAIITAFMFGLSELDEKLAAQPLEIMLPLMGIILMTPVFMPEQNENIRDVVRSKKTSYLGVCFIRLICSAVILTAITAVFVVYMRSQDSAVTARLFRGSVATSLALGSIGFFASAVSDNTIVGYMTAIMYYLCNFAMKDKLDRFYLFSMMSGSFEEKRWLLGMAAVLVAAGFFCRRAVRKQ